MIYILLPAYNEEKNLLKILEKIERLVDRERLKITVVLIDDCSTDNSIRFKNYKSNFRLLYKAHKKNSGLSIAMETGFKIINEIANDEDIVITLDSDNTHPIEIISGMFKEIKNSNDIVIASRFQKNSKVKGVTFFRLIMSYGAKYLFKLFYPFKNLNDYTCNFRAYKFYLIKKILKDKTFFKNEDFNIAAKIIIFLTNSYNSVNLKEIPFILGYDKKIGKSKMKIMKTIFLTLKLIIFKKFLNN